MARGVGHGALRIPRPAEGREGREGQGQARGFKDRMRSTPTSASRNARPSRRGGRRGEGRDRGWSIQGGSHACAGRAPARSRPSFTGTPFIAGEKKGVACGAAAVQLPHAGAPASLDSEPPVRSRAWLLPGRFLDFVEEFSATASALLGPSPVGLQMKEANTKEKPLNSEVRLGRGPGWVWLVAEGPMLRLQTTSMHNRPQGVPLLSLDMWEHAYYAQCPPPLPPAEVRVARIRPQTPPPP